MRSSSALRSRGAERPLLGSKSEPILRVCQARLQFRKASLAGATSFAPTCRRSTLLRRCMMSSRLVWWLKTCTTRSIAGGAYMVFQCMRHPRVGFPSPKPNKPLTPDPRSLEYGGLPPARAARAVASISDRRAAVGNRRYNERQSRA